jgi:hypothetical protein
VTGNAKDRRRARRAWARAGWRYAPPGEFRDEVLGGAAFFRFVDRAFTDAEWRALDSPAPTATIGDADEPWPAPGWEQISEYDHGGAHVRVAVKKDEEP